MSGPRRAAFVAIALLTCTAGCYAAHERPLDGAAADAAPRDAITACLAEGTYDVPFRVESQSPPGCIGMMPHTVPFRVPPRVEDFVGMCGGDMGTVTSTGPCAWAIDVRCLIPDDVFTARGTITASGEVRGRIEVAAETLAGHCMGVLVLGP